MNTIRKRKPHIIGQVLEQHELPGHIRERLHGLRREIGEGRIADPFYDYDPDPGLFETEELAAWKREITRYAGRPWIGIPWYFAEAYFYLRLLLAFGYYEEGLPTFRKDPFAPFKERELFAPGGGLDMAASILPTLLDANHGAETAADRRERLRTLLLFSLWGNRIDLSNFSADHYRGRDLLPDPENLIIDHSPALADRLLAARRIDLVLDNAGPELVCDLICIYFLLGLNPELGITLHAKRCPFFVSDATQADVMLTLQALAGSDTEAVSGIGAALHSMLGSGGLTVNDHYFWNGPCHFTALPSDLAAGLSGSNLVLFKGDASYRRLLGDRKWEPWADMEAITGYFPSPFASMRTLKAEIVVDLKPERVEELDREDPDWRTNGKRGLIRLVPGPGPEATGRSSS